jgi:EAL domain-containing protein (putative c-di-GMP-specific phosphodiesterase class I)
VNVVPTPGVEARLSLGPDVRIAVDDAGAGMANFRHFVELRPDFREAGHQPRQRDQRRSDPPGAGGRLKHFARVSGRSLIAEGVETEAERETLMQLVVRTGQGYLLGTPAPAESWVDCSPGAASLAQGAPRPPSSSSRPPGIGRTRLRRRRIEMVSGRS